MFSTADRYRRRAIEARQRGAQETEPAHKLVLEEIADHWLGLAEQAEWLERQAPPMPMGMPSPTPQPMQQQTQPKKKEE
jgi:hypothetical protein